jgi:hypothetical protein
VKFLVDGVEGRDAFVGHGEGEWEEEVWVAEEGFVDVEGLGFGSVGMGCERRDVRAPY